MFSKFSRAIVPVTMAVVLVAAVAHVASSSPGGGFGGHMGRHGMRRINVLGVPLPLLLKTANLTDAQKQQIHQIIATRRTTRKAEIQQLKAAKDQIAAKYTSTGAVTASDFSGPVQQITQIQDQMTNEQIQDAIAIRNVLTPAQLQQISQTKSKLDQIHAEMHALFAQSQTGSTTPTPTE